jgi:hypothetical protein
MAGLQSRARHIHKLILWQHNLRFTSRNTQACYPYTILGHFHHAAVLKTHIHREHLHRVSLSSKWLDYAHFT